MQNDKCTAVRRLKGRQLWLNIHLYLGLLIGAVWVLLGLTGSINVFRWDIDEWLNPELIVANPQTSPQSLDQIFQAVRAAYPARSGTWSLEMPRHTAGMIMARHFQQAGSDHELLFVSVNPYTSEIVASRFYSDFGFLVTWLYALHSTLFLGGSGPQIVGVFALLLIVSLVSGAYLWWPKPGKFKQALTIKRRAGIKRLNYDIHKLTGVFGFLLLMTVAFSGACLVYSKYLRPAVALLSPINGGFNPQPPPPKGLHSTIVYEVKPISLTQAVAIATQVFPDAAVRFLKTPADKNGFYGIQMRQSNEASQFFTTTSVWVDQFSGEILAVRDPNQFTAGETFLNLIWPLHNGEVLGLSGRILVFVTGFMPLVLYVTGVIRWLQKRRAKRAKAGI